MSATDADPRLTHARPPPRRPLSLSWSDPRVRAVVDVTDHAGGTNPFYTSAKGGESPFHQAAKA